MAAVPTVASLKPVFLLSLDLEEVQPVSSRDGGDEVIVVIKSGFTKSYDEKFPFNSTIYHGRDDILVNPGATHNNLNCLVFGKTDDNVGYTIHYGGVVVQSDAVNNVLGGKSNGHAYEDAYVTNNMLVHLSKNATEKYDWIKFHNLVGRGRFFRDENKGLHIEYIMHIIV